MLAVPFVGLMPARPFFFVDLASLLACYGGFLIVARRVSIGMVCAVLAFVRAGEGGRRGAGGVRQGDPAADGVGGCRQSAVFR
mgnify:CR=1 FL=1